MGRSQEQGSNYTVVGIVDDDTRLNQAVAGVRELGIGGEDLTVIVKRKDPDEPEPFPKGTRYIIVPNDSRGLEISVGFAVVFAIIALLLAFTTPAIGALLFVFFISLAAILAAGSLTRVGVEPILIDLEVPAEDSNSWNEEFEMGKALVFVSTEQRSLLRSIWEIFQGQGGDFYIVERRLEPRPVSGAALHRAGENKESVTEAQEFRG